jgi:hypothetical protein
MTIKELPQQTPLALTTCDTPLLSLPALALTDKYEWTVLDNTYFILSINIYSETMTNVNYTLYCHVF